MAPPPAAESGGGAENGAERTAEAFPPPKDRTAAGRFLCYAAGLYWLVTTVVIIPFACLAYYYIILLPIKMFRPEIYVRLENAIARLCCEHWMAAAHYYGMRVRDTGDRVETVANGRCVLMANHLGLADHFAIMTSLGVKGNISGRWLWLIFHIWRWTPLGLAWSLHGNYMISGGRAKRQRQLNHFRQHIRDRYWRDDHRWIVLYPEGTRLFLIERSNRAYAEKHGLPLLRHCALPRMGAIEAILDETAPLSHKHGAPCGAGLCPPTCGKPVRHLIDATIGYPGGTVPHINDILMGRLPQPYTITVHYRLLPMEGVPARDPSRLRAYLVARWVEKDRLLGHYYATGAFPTEGDGGAAGTRPCQTNLKRALLAEAFFWLSWACHVLIWLRPAAFYIGQALANMCASVHAAF